MTPEEKFEEFLDREYPDRRFWCGYETPKIKSMRKAFLACAEWKQGEIERLNKRIEKLEDDIHEHMGIREH